MDLKSKYSEPCGEVVFLQAANSACLSEKPTLRQPSYTFPISGSRLSYHRGGMQNVSQEPNKLVSIFHLLLVSNKQSNGAASRQHFCLVKKARGFFAARLGAVPHSESPAGLLSAPGVSQSAAWLPDRVTRQPTATNPGSGEMVGRMLASFPERIALWGSVPNWAGPPRVGRFRHVP